MCWILVNRKARFVTGFDLGILCQPSRDGLGKYSSGEGFAALSSLLESIKQLTLTILLLNQSYLFLHRITRKEFVNRRDFSVYIVYIFYIH